MVLCCWAMSTDSSIFANAGSAVWKCNPPIVGVPSASIGVRTSRGEDLARAHIFEITTGDATDALRITLIARGLTEPGGAIGELERQQL